jgi:hypothetical protein
MITFFSHYWMLGIISLSPGARNQEGKFPGFIWNRTHNHSEEKPGELHG